MDNISFLKSNKLCPLTNWFQNGQVKENRKGFCLPSPTSYEARHIWRWKGKDQSRSPEREVSWTKTKLKLKSFRIRLVRHDSFRKKAFGSVCKLGRLLHLDVPKTDPPPPEPEWAMDAVLERRDEVASQQNSVQNGLGPPYLSPPILRDELQFIFSGEEHEI